MLETTRPSCELRDALCYIRKLGGPHDHEDRPRAARHGASDGKGWYVSPNRNTEPGSLLTIRGVSTTGQPERQLLSRARADGEEPPRAPGRRLHES